MIVAFYSGDSIYSADIGTLGLVVAKAHLTVTASPATTTYGSPLPTLSATISGFVNGDSRAVVSGSAALSTPAQASSGVGNYPISVGLGTLFASNYVFPTLVGATLTVNQAPLVVSADFNAKVAGSPNPPLTATITGFVNNDTAAVVSGSPALSTTATTSSPPGVYPIVLGIGTLSASNYYFPTLLQGSLAVLAPGGTELSVVPSSPSPTFGRPLTFTATVISGVGSTVTPTGTIQFQADGTNFGPGIVLSGGSATSPSTAGLGAGGHTITAIYSGDGNYPGNIADVGVVVAKAHLTVTASSVFSTYGSPLPGLVASLSGFVDGDDASVVSGSPSLSTTATASSAVGVYPITVGLGTLSAANYDFPSFVGSAFTVSKAHLTVTASAASSTYGSTIPTLGVVIMGFANGDNASAVSGSANLSTTASASSGVGHYPIAVSGGTLSAANYDFPNLVGGALAVNKAHLTVTANDASSTYGNSIPPLGSLGVTLGGFVNGDTASVVSGSATLSTVATPFSGAGVYPITVGAGTLFAANYDFVNLVNGALTVKPADLTVTASAASSVYGGAIPPLDAAFVGFLGGDNASVVSGAPALSTTATSASGVGIYPIAVGLGTLSAANYDFPNFVGSTLTVTPAHLTVTADASSSPFGGPFSRLTATFSGFVNGDSPSDLQGAPNLSTTATPSSGVGVYPITIGPGTLSAANYDFPTLVASTLTVTKAHLTVTAGSASITYGESIPAPSATISGFVNGDTLAVVTGSPALLNTATTSSSAGTYPIMVGAGTLSAVNYDFTNLVDGNLTVSKVHLTVTASSASSVYGGPIPVLSATLSGFVGSDTALIVSGAPSLTTTATSSSGVGLYPIAVGVGTLSAANYDFPDLVGSFLTVAEAPLTVTADDASSTYGSPIPALTATITGFVAGDTSAVVSGSPALSTLATPTSAVGPYAITVGLGTLTAANYEFVNRVGGTLTVIPATATLSLGGLLFTYDGTEHSATVSTNPAGLGGVTIIYSLNQTAVPAPAGAGSYAVVAALDNPDYTAATVTGTLVINPATSTITWANPAPAVIGSALSTTQLNAKASVPGIFTYSPPLGTVLNTAGSQLLSVSFTPLDATDILPATAQATLDVIAPAVVQFGSGQFTVNQDAGTASVVVTRSGDESSAVTVNFATGGGSALPGTQYTPVATTVEFGPGETSKTITVPIQNKPLGGGDVSVGLTLSAPGPATVIGALSSATLVIQENDPSSSLVAPVTVRNVQIAKLKTGKHTTSKVIVVQFSDALNSAAAGNLANFSLVSAGKDNKLGTHDDKRIVLAQSTYDPVTFTVTLRTRKPLVLTPSLQLNIAASGLTDSLGRPLDGDDNGQPGGDFTAILSKRGITI